jgi:putative nucleotidyltransferase with HDIG domain
LSGPVDSLATLDIQDLRCLVLSVGLVDAFAVSDLAGVARGQAAAAAAAALARELGLGCDTAGTAALLHNLGALLLGRFAPERWRAMAAEPIESPRTRLILEKRVFGFDHCELGASVARQWHFPDDIVQAIWDHQCPREDAADRMTDLVHVAWAIGEEEADDTYLDAGAMRRLGLHAADAAMATARHALRQAGLPA